jgi:hypothetical protein
VIHPQAAGGQTSLMASRPSLPRRDSPLDQPVFCRHGTDLCSAVHVRPMPDLTTSAHRPSPLHPPDFASIAARGPQSDSRLRPPPAAGGLCRPALRLPGGLCIRLCPPVSSRCLAPPVSDLRPHRPHCLCCTALGNRQRAIEHTALEISV